MQGVLLCTKRLFASRGSPEGVGRLCPLNSEPPGVPTQLRADTGRSYTSVPRVFAGSYCWGPIAWPPLSIGATVVPALPTSAYQALYLSTTELTTQPYPYRTYRDFPQAGRFPHPECLTS